ncbi:hypothetical protein GOBAR_DD25837 [Gossypium barbadense]|nr:hypothetical protein GOBAR_DD25837 [Gossypium barbadense]
MDFVKKASSTLRFNLKGDPTHFEACKDLEVCLLGLVVVRSEPELLLRYLLQTLGHNQGLSWLVKGDFNEIACSFEKRAGGGGEGVGLPAATVAYRRRIFVTSLIKGWPRPHSGIGFCLTECGVCLILFLSILLFCLQHPLCMVLSSLISHRVSALNLGGLARSTKRQQTYMGLKRRLDELNAFGS